MRILKPVVLLCALPLLGACSYLTPYKLDVPQGTPITADQVAKLKVGMTRSQVRFVLGSPLLTDTFHRNRWDFIYYDSRGGEVKDIKRYHVLFDEERLISMGGDTLPERAQVSRPDPRAGDKAVP